MATMRRGLGRLLIPVLFPVAAAAQINQHPVHWSAPRDRISVRAGDTVRVLLHATIAESFHLYSVTQPSGGPIRTAVTVDPGSPFTLVGRVRAPSPETAPDANFGIVTEVYSDSVSFGLTLRAQPGVASGRATASVRIRYQACTARYCLPPRVDTVGVAFLTEAKAAR